MNAVEILNHAGIMVSYSSIDVPSFRAQAQVNTRAARFARFQQEVLRTNWQDGIALATHLFAFDGFSPLSLHLLRTNTAALQTTEYGLALELSESNKLTHRYLLSSITQAITSSPIRWSDEHLDKLLHALCNTTAYEHSSKSEVLKELHCDQLAWTFQQLPSAIFSHLAGLTTCTPLDPDAWERERTGMAPAIAEDIAVAEIEANAGDLLDATTSTTADNSSAALIQQALNALYEAKGETTRQSLMRWNRSLVALAPKIHNYSPQVGLVISWIAHVVEHGTSKKGTHADPATRRRYVLVAAKPIFSAIQSLPRDPCLWTKDMRVSAYVAIMHSANNSDKRALSAALASFQDFLSEAFEIQPLDAGLKDIVPASAPRAQCIYIHEVERASRWIQSAHMEDHGLKVRLQVALWLAYDAPFRINELLHLRKGNITPLPDGSFEITILPPRGGQLKTPVATRRVWIRHSQACGFLKSLIEERERDGWTSQDLLFASGIDGRTPHRKNRLRFLLLLALKAATGDPNMTIHALRHAWVCRELLTCLTGSGIHNLNRLAHLAAQVGHESAHTTLEYYFHQMEVVLHVHMDAALRFSLDWNSDSGARYTSLSASAIRQRAARSQQSVGTVIWSLLNAATSATNDRYACTPKGWSLPSPPDLKDKSLTPLTPGLIKMFLLAAEMGEHTSDVLAQRYGLSNVQGRNALQQITDIKAKICESTYKRKRIQSSSLDRTKLDLQISKIEQAKYKEVVNSLDEVPTDLELLQRGSTAWQKLRNRYGYISLMDSDSSFNFLALLERLGLRAYNFDVVIASNETPGHAKAVRAEVESNFLLAMAALPHFIEDAPPHPARPAAYLQWHPQISRQKTSANSDLKGLDAAMVVIHVYLQLLQKATS